MEHSLPFFEMDHASESCVYLPEEKQVLKYRVIFTLHTKDYAQMLARGWRRQGMYFFKPNCPQCSKCHSLRVQLTDFQPTKSQRRTIRRNQHIEIDVSQPRADQEHIDLFNRYHDDMHSRRGWNYASTTVDEYTESFLSGDWPFVREMTFRSQGKLVGVSLIDILDNEASSIYFYHDPIWRPLGPGTFSLLSELSHMQHLKLKYHYLGYWIKDCQSMEYKSRFGPHEILDEYVDDTTQPSWSRAAT